MRGRPHCSASWPVSTGPDTGRVEAGHGLRIGYYAQEHETIDVKRTVLENIVAASPEISSTEARNVLGSFLFVGDDVSKPAGVLSGGRRPGSPSR